MPNLRPFAENARYWKTGKSSPDVWLDKCIALIADFGGDILGSGFGVDNIHGTAAYRIRFRLDGEVFHFIWPVLPSESDDTFSARRQAATMMYHAVKSRCVEVQVLGVRVAFFSWLELPDGRVAFQLANNAIADNSPRGLLSAPVEEDDA